MQRAHRFAPALAALACGLASADTLASGYARTGVPFPAGTVVATLSTEEFVAFDGTTVTLHVSSGTVIDTLAVLTGTAFPSFVRIDPSETFVVVGESLNGGIYSVPLFGGGGASFVTSLSFNYDAVFEDADHLLVSAAADMVADNEIYRVDLSSGALDRVAALPGASGPLALAPSGELYYATSDFPLPPGLSEVLRFSAAQLAAGSELSIADATSIGDGFPGASSLAVDPANGNLFLSASDFGSGDNALYRVEGSESASPILYAGDPFDFLSNLEFLPGSGPASFHAWQPEGGGALRYNVSGLRFAQNAERPMAFLSGPGLLGPGDFDVNLCSSAPDGTAYTLYGPASLVPGTELAIFLPNQGLSVFLGLEPATMLFDAGPIALDAGGNASRTYPNPGGLEGTLAIQMLVLTDVGQIANTSSVLFN